MMGKRHTAYSFETKAAAVRAVVDGGMTKPGAMAKFGMAPPSSFKRWSKAYREEGPEAPTGLELWGQPPRYSRAPPTGAATGRSPCACEPSRACAWPTRRRSR